jgi:hypothetical protein
MRSSENRVYRLVVNANSFNPWAIDENIRRLFDIVVLVRLCWSSLFRIYGAVPRRFSKKLNISHCLFFKQFVGVLAAHF